MRNAKTVRPPRSTAERWAFRYDLGVKIYTKTGDGGETSLYSGGRVPKDHARIEAYGTLDELNALIGLLLAEPVPDEAADALAEVQGALFSIGAALADPDQRGTHDAAAWAVEPLEGWIDRMDAELEPLSSFILPGGTRSAAVAHVARAVCRRAERRVLAAEREAGEVPEGVVPYVNRLSDLLFVLARWLNARLGVADSPWTGSKAGTSEE